MEKVFSLIKCDEAGGKLLGTLDFYSAAKKKGVQFEDWMAGGMMRADLLTILSESLPQGVLRLGLHICYSFNTIGKTVQGYTETKDKVTLHLENGENEECDLVIAADGIKSSMRKLALGPQEPRFAKQGM